MSESPCKTVLVWDVGTWQGLTPIHFPAQSKLLLVLEATASAHSRAQPETFLPMPPRNIAHIIQCSHIAKNVSSQKLNA
jgi:hypothetical protein